MHRISKINGGRIHEHIKANEEKEEAVPLAQTQLEITEDSTNINGILMVILGILVGAAAVLGSYLVILKKKD
ncbi:MAG: hypothetical protein IKL51_03955 [Lachnospiraceae bacterium]|nr:hypothetical protein [Lachnospiraceae bacterium]